MLFFSVFAWISDSNMAGVTHILNVYCYSLFLRKLPSGDSKMAGLKHTLNVYGYSLFLHELELSWVLPPVTLSWMRNRHGQVFTICCSYLSLLDSESRMNQKFTDNCSFLIQQLSVHLMHISDGAGFEIKTTLDWAGANQHRISPSEYAWVE